jgi:hypothetical protein
MLEPEVRPGTILLGEHETTGPQAVGFAFERFGASYDHFDVSTDGFITLLGRDRQAVPAAHVRLVDERTRLGPGRLSWEVRGASPRRRLVVSHAEAGSTRSTLQVTVHERTGIVEVGWEGQSFGEPTMRQLDMVHSSPSRSNSARKIG